MEQQKNRIEGDEINITSWAKQGHTRDFLLAFPINKIGLGMANQNPTVSLGLKFESNQS